ncbi:MAG: metallophosphoesterase [Myxococcales bacterium]|nr:metallophosphoesterase [Myxococcales bacterium]
MVETSPNERVLLFPATGTLYVAGDIHGNRRDFLEIVRLFRRTYARNKMSFLLFLGDLVHGPSDASKQSWPRELGEHFPDESVAVIRDYLRLKKRFAGNIFSLLGNHDHSHVGGPHTGKFYEDETLHLEAQMSPKLLAQMKELFARLPLLAVTRAGLVFSHASPSAALDGLDDVDQVELEGYESCGVQQMLQSGFLGQILWRRYAPAPEVDEYLAKTSRGGFANRIAVYSHDVVDEGIARIEPNQLCVCTSFGVYDAQKRYLKLDLSRRYERLDDLVEGREIRRLWPDA